VAAAAAAAARIEAAAAADSPEETHRSYSPSYQIEIAQ